ncbi:hypothetical protein [Cesiribacter sp. SM1]|uniref:hypothetical protein n=1 Tax=Cesiribacter sp. SM1 TaxID=2861196 RepID=UPI001CD7B5B4|nr:hypothetical protein [Cesiribacter sp. SM1]
MRKISSLLFLCFYLLMVQSATAQNAPAPIKLIDFVLTPSAADWKYKINQQATLQVTVLINDVPLKDAILPMHMDLKCCR